MFDNKKNMSENIQQIEKNGDITLTQRQMWYALIMFLVTIIPTALSLYNHVETLNNKVSDIEKKLEKSEIIETKFKEDFKNLFNDFEKKQIQDMTRIKAKLGLID